MVYRWATKFVKFVSFLEKSPCSKLGRCIFIGLFKKTCHSANLLRIILHSKFVYTSELLHRNNVKAIEKLVKEKLNSRLRLCISGARTIPLGTQGNRFYHPTLFSFMLYP